MLWPLMGKTAETKNNKVEELYKLSKEVNGKHTNIFLEDSTLNVLAKNSDVTFYEGNVIFLFKDFSAKVQLRKNYYAIVLDCGDYEAENPDDLSKTYVLL